MLVSFLIFVKLWCGLRCFWLSVFLILFKCFELLCVGVREFRRGECDLIMKFCFVLCIL